MARTKATHRRSQARQRQREARRAALIGVPAAAAAAAAAAVEEVDKQDVNDYSTREPDLHVADPQAGHTKAASPAQSRCTKVPNSMASAPGCEHTSNASTATDQASLPDAATHSN
jgi:hypothetical protein